MPIGPTPEDEMIDPFDNDEKRARDTAKALRLKRDGKTIAEIAGALNVCERTVNARLKEGYAEIRARAAEEHYAIEYLRLEELGLEARKILQDARTDDPELALKAIDRVLKAAEARIKLTGIAAPDKSEVTVNEVKPSETLMDRLAKVTADLDKKRSARGRKAES